MPRKNFLQDLIFWNMLWYQCLNATLTPQYIGQVSEHQNRLILYTTRHSLIFTISIIEFVYDEH